MTRRTRALWSPAPTLLAREQRDGRHAPAPSGRARARSRPRRSRPDRGSARRQDRAGAVEADAARGRAGEVVLAVADVGPAVDDRDADGPPPVAQRDARAARERLVGDAERADAERAAAAEVVAVEAGAVPRRAGGAVHVGAADGLVGRADATAAEDADARGRAQRPADARDELVV